MELLEKLTDCINLVKTHFGNPLVLICIEYPSLLLYL